jgi:predicted transcriptional regulator
LKTFTLKLNKTPIKKMMTELRQAIRTKIPNVHDNELLCGSIEAMTDAISKSKLEAFAAIVEHKPRTLRELATILGKDVGNISRDVKGLELLGLIDLVPDKTVGPRAIRPVAKFDKILFDFATTSKVGS